MLRSLIFLLLFTLNMLDGGLPSCKTDKQQMIQTLDIIQNSFSVQYAPAEWKKTYLGWDLEVEIDKAKNRVLALDHPSVKEFQKILADFFSSTHDFHVSITFFSTESATLPFSVKGINNRYFITGINRSKVSKKIYPFRAGDELTHFGKKPIQEVIAELKNRDGGVGNDLTSQAMAEFFLTTRIGRLGHEVPSGPIMIRVKHNGSSRSSRFQLIWEHQPERVKSRALSPIKTDNDPIKICLEKMNLETPYYQTIMETQKLDNDNEEKRALGGRRGKLPALGKKYWESDPSSSFEAYIYQTKEGDRVGYLRIPHYNGNEEKAAEFAAIIKQMQEGSSALVIDQTDNPGGSAFYLYALLSMLTDKPLSTPKHRLVITQKEVMSAISNLPILENIRSDEEAIAILGTTLEGNVVTYQTVHFMINYYRFIISEWKAGRTLTNPFYLYGTDYINPHPDARYTKPILVLTNCMDFSAADFFPAILQDNKRAVIFGERTAGAGGIVVGATFPNNFGIDQYQYTASIAERVDSHPIENLGVEPNIECSITEKDLQNNYVDYIQKLREAVRQLLHGKRSQPAPDQRDRG